MTYVLIRTELVVIVNEFGKWSVFKIVNKECFPSKWNTASLKSTARLGYLSNVRCFKGHHVLIPEFPMVHTDWATGIKNHKADLFTLKDGFSFLDEWVITVPLFGPLSHGCNLGLSLEGFHYQGTQDKRTESGQQSINTLPLMNTLANIPDLFLTRKSNQSPCV